MDDEPRQRIAVFRALRFGDLLCTTPVLRALRIAYPAADVTLIGLAWQQQLVSRYRSYLDHFIWFPGHPGFDEQPARLELLPYFFKQVQTRKFDLVLQLHGSGGIANPLAAMFGARQLAGFYRPDAYCPDPTAFIAYPEAEHEIHRQLRLLQHLGIEPQGDWLEFPLFPADKVEAAACLQAAGLAGKHYVVLHPGASQAEKRWPVERFAAVGDRLYQQGFTVVLTGIQAEQPLTDAVAGAMQAPAINLAGRTSMGALGVLLSEAELLICNDTGVSHLAAALGVPSLVLFMSTDVQRWAPLNRQLHQVIQAADQVSPLQIAEQALRLIQSSIPQCHFGAA